jgi:hypothetical protein
MLDIHFGNVVCNCNVLCAKNWPIIMKIFFGESHILLEKLYVIIFY